jgi:hypothetical protein
MWATSSAVNEVSEFETPIPGRITILSWIDLRLLV